MKQCRMEATVTVSEEIFERVGTTRSPGFRACAAAIFAAAWLATTLVSLATPDATRATPRPLGDCAARPGPLVAVHSEGADDAGDPGPSEFRGVVVEAGGADDLGFRHVAVRDRDGVVHRFAIALPPGQRLPLAPGLAATFLLEERPGTPGAAALVVSDAHGLRFAAVRDQAPGAGVARGGVDGLTLAFEPSGCPALPHDPCLASLENVALRVRSGARSVLLLTGAKARVGGWNVRCQAAQRARYAKGCADVVVVGLSWTATRASLDR
jgi:hypothetical protein